MAARRRSREELEFLAAYDASQFPQVSVAVDVALVTVVEGALKALLLERTEYPDQGRHALPGGFVRPEESVDDAAARVLRDKVGLERVYLEQLYTFGAPHRDPRTRVISVAYYALVHPEKLNGSLGTHATIDVPWKGETGGPVRARSEQAALPLAFDHADVLGMVVKRMRGKLDYAGIGFELLPRAFTLRRLQSVYETILGQRVNKDSFRRRMLQSGRVIATGRSEDGVSHRPAALYRFSRKAIS